MVKQKAGILTRAYVRLCTKPLIRCYCRVKMNFHIAFPDKPIYLTRLTGKNTADTMERTDSVSLSKCFMNYNEIMLFCTVPKNSNDNISSYLQSAVESQKLLRTISSKLGYDVGLMYCSNDDQTMSINNQHDQCPVVYRGIFVSGDVLDNSELTALARDHGFKTFFHLLRNKNDGCKIIEKDSQTMETISENNYAVQDYWEKLGKDGAVKQYQSRLFTYPELCSVFRGYKESREILYKCKDIPEVVTLLDIADKYMPKNFRVEELQSQLRHPFVVVEGLDATGKTTLTETLEKKLSATRYYTPPPEIQHLRKVFDALPEIIRRAYYCIGNYIVSIQIARECQHKSVIMDRFWHSTTAYAIANESSTSDMPQRQHWVYQWPPDLLKPTLVLFLTVTEEVRKQRLWNRAQEKTFEELHLDKDLLFRQRLCEAYRRMENPSCVEIDATGSKESVVMLAVEELQKHGILM